MHPVAGPHPVLGAVQVGLDGGGRDVQPGSDLLGGQSLGGRRDDIELAPAEPGRGLPGLRHGALTLLGASVIGRHHRGCGHRLRAHVAQQLGQCARRQDGLAHHDPAQSGVELLGGRVLEQVAHRTGLNDPHDGVIDVPGGQSHDMRMTRSRTDLARRLNPVHDGHPKIHEHDIGLNPLNGLDRLATVTGLGDHRVVLTRPQKRFDGGAGERVVVDEDDAHRGGRRGGRGGGGVGHGASLGACADTITVPTAQTHEDSSGRVPSALIHISRGSGRSAASRGRVHRAPRQVRAHHEPAVAVGAGTEGAAADLRPPGHAAQARAALGVTGHGTDS